MNYPVAHGSSGFARPPIKIAVQTEKGKQTKQTKQSSFNEAVINTVVGFVIALAGQLTVFPMFGINSLTLEDNLLIGSIFMLLSTARSYAIRRVMEQLRVRGIMP